MVTETTFQTDAERLEARLADATPEEIRQAAFSSTCGPILEQLKSVRDQLQVISDALDRIGTWDENDR